jgi:hypothetical protein
VLVTSFSSPSSIILLHPKSGYFLAEIMATDDDAAIAAILQEAEHSYQHEENAKAWSMEDVGVPLDALA